VDKDYNVKVADFGLSVPNTPESFAARGRCGYIRCIAPEILIKREYSSKSDVYSYAILLWYEFIVLILVIIVLTLRVGNF
jgi:serine/threonine protein kinase